MKFRLEAEIIGDITIVKVHRKTWFRAAGVTVRDPDGKLVRIEEGQTATLRLRADATRDMGQP